MNTAVRTAINMQSMFRQSNTL